MKKNNNKKPTNADFKNAINHLIRETYEIGRYLKNVDAAFTAYVQYKKDDDKFTKYLDERRQDAANKQNSGKSASGDRTAQIKDIQTRTKGKSNKK
tara:strand:- start:5550 stop:5837 length:288 start_codon:yes stop_codon:yes gene_type:complete